MTQQEGGDVVGDEEMAARFLMSSSWFAKTTGRIKHQAFLPAPDNDTSVFRTRRGASAFALWQLGAAVLEGKPHHGAAIVEVAVIRRNGLAVVADEPPPSHANIRGWPLDPDPELQKARRKTVAKAIAEEAFLEPKTEPLPPDPQH